MLSTLPISIRRETTTGNRTPGQDRMKSWTHHCYISRISSMALLRELGPTFTTGTARRAGVRYEDLYAARDAGELLELSRGVFRRAEAPLASWPDLLAVSYRAPRAVVCMLTAAMVHGLTDQSPEAVQIAVPRGTWAPQIDYPPVEVFIWRADQLALGLTTVEAAPTETVNITSKERTVVDLMRLRARVGEAEAHRVLRRYLADPTAKPGAVVDLARTLGVLGPVRAALELLTAS